MRIGIIGAGIAGLSAGRLLAEAGHEITVLEKNSYCGGRLATRPAGGSGGIKADYGAPYLSVKSPEFGAFVAELIARNRIKVLADQFSYFDGEKILDHNPNRSKEIRYTVIEGVQSVANYLARKVDLSLSEKAAGITYIGSPRTKKRAWMINLSSFNTFEADAVIVATSAPEAYGLILTCQDEVETLTAIRDIDSVSYDPSYTMVVGYESSGIPYWAGVDCLDRDISFISNEGNKSETPSENILVIHSTAAFAREHRHSDPGRVKELLLNRLTLIAGEQFSSPEWSELHFWKYSRAKSVINKPFIQMGGVSAPLALVGDYLDGRGVDAAYRSGYLLAESWIEMFASLNKGVEEPQL